ncbi:hypothetical protein DFH08DRAFT_930804 [Mycena albidolilacea]|uniref:Uncharacterized protein n=1 Tax=Mycena albidolilacea TaxID=1033008 RepID=A0AAD7F0F4_9AGAR|nr:hypothetical protein DFH08DRAFT_930804 [Mycena albidolilacea]
MALTPSTRTLPAWLVVRAMWYSLPIYGHVSSVELSDHRAIAASTCMRVERYEPKTPLQAAARPVPMYSVPVPNIRRQCCDIHNNACAMESRSTRSPDRAPPQSHISPWMMLEYGGGRCPGIRASEGSSRTVQRQGGAGEDDRENGTRSGIGAEKKWSKGDQRYAPNNPEKNCQPHKMDGERDKLGSGIGGGGDEQRQGAIHDAPASPGSADRVSTRFPMPEGDMAVVSTATWYSESSTLTMQDLTWLPGTQREMPIERKPWAESYVPHELQHTVRLDVTTSSMTYDALMSGSSERRFESGVCGDKGESVDSHDPPYRHVHRIHWQVGGAFGCSVCYHTPKEVCKGGP